MVWDSVKGEDIKPSFSKLERNEYVQISGTAWKLPGWKDDFRATKVHIYKMVFDGEIQGLVSFNEQKNYLYIRNFERPNRRTNQRYKFVGENLMAFICQKSKEMGHKGRVFLMPKEREKLKNFYLNRIGMDDDTIEGKKCLAIYEKRAEELIKEFY